MIEANAEQMSMRFKEFLSWSKYKQTQFAELAGVSQSSLSEMLAGKRRLNVEVLYAITHEFPEINLHWMLTGEGNMQDKTEQQTERTQNEFCRSALMRIFNRVSNEVFKIDNFEMEKKLYYTTLIYTRVMRKDDQHSEAEIEKAISDLNMILIDRELLSLEQVVEAALSRNESEASVAGILSVIDEYTQKLGTNKGRYGKRLFSQNSQLEKEFLDGMLS